MTTTLPESGMTGTSNPESCPSCSIYVFWNCRCDHARAILPIWMQLMGWDVKVNQKGKVVKVVRKQKQKTS